MRKIQDFCPRDIESCHHEALRRVKLWSLNSNWFFEEPHQLTKFPFKALIAIFWDLQTLWPSSLTKTNLLRFRCSSGHVLSKTKYVTPQFSYVSDITNSSSFNDKNFRQKSVLENFRTNVLKCAVSVTTMTEGVLVFFKERLVYFSLALQREVDDSFQSLVCVRMIAILPKL